MSKAPAPSVTWIAAAGGVFAALGAAGAFAPLPYAGVIAASASALGLTAVATLVVRRDRRRVLATVERATRLIAASSRDDGLDELPAHIGEVVLEARRAVERAVEEGRRCATRKRELELKVRVLDQQRRHLGAILNALGDAVLVTDAFGELAVANEAAARLLCFDLKRSAHQPIDRLIDDAELLKLIRRAGEARHAGARRRVEHELVVGGQTRSFEVTLGLVGRDRFPGDTALGLPFDRVRAEAGAVAGGDPAAVETGGIDGSVVTILRDVTRDKQLAAVKTDFVSRVSHELRTPLSSIKAYVEMLIDGEAHDEAARGEFYGIIQNETDRLSRLIDNILSISRIESGVVKVSRESLSLARLARDAVDVILPQAQAKGIDLVYDEVPLYFQVHADRDVIFQAIINLMSNAVKYTPDGGRVTVSLGVDEQAKTAEIAIADTGAGIPAASLPHVFDKFYRVRGHGKLAKGTGLGLALVKHVVETVHGGSVSVTSEVGTGSTFTITLPQHRR